MEKMEIKSLDPKNAKWNTVAESNWIRVSNEDGGYIELIYRDGRWEVHADKGFVIQPTSSNHLLLRDVN